MKTIPESIRDWVDNQKSAFQLIEDLAVHIGGEDADRSPPFLAIYEADSRPFYQDDVAMHGVTAFGISAELHTLPQDDGTAPSDESEMRQNLYDILGNLDSMLWIENRNDWSIFDIGTCSAITTPEDGVRVSRFTLQVIACPI